MKHRTQILLEEWQYEALRSIAERKDRSLSDLVREIISGHFRRSGKNRGKRLREIEGLGRDPKAAGRDHDVFLYGEKKRCS